MKVLIVNIVFWGCYTPRYLQNNITHMHRIYWD